MAQDKIKLLDDTVGQLSDQLKQAEAAASSKVRTAADTKSETKLKALEEKVLKITGDLEEASSDRDGLRELNSLNENEIVRLKSELAKEKIERLSDKLEAESNKAKGELAQRVRYLEQEIENLKGDHQAELTQATLVIKQEERQKHAGEIR